MTHDRRGDPQYSVSESNLLTVSVTRKSDDSSVGSTAALLNLSRGGFRLKLDESLPTGEEIRLSLSSTEFEQRIQSEAVVCWAEPAPGDEWVIGCVLKEKIEQDSIEELAAVGALDRRGDSRRPISFVAEAKSELEPNFTTVQIVDISDSGFCAVADQLCAKLNDRLMLRIDGESSTPASYVRVRVAWIDDMEGGQTFGCTFLTKADHAQMHAIANRDERDDTPVDIIESPQAVTRWSLVGFVVVLIFFVQFFCR